jgi:hypothetical protein
MRKNKNIEKNTKLKDQKKLIQLNKIESLELKISTLLKDVHENEKNKVEFKKIENSFKREKLSNVLGLNKTYTELKRKIKIVDSNSIMKKINILNEQLLQEKIKERKKDDLIEKKLAKKHEQKELKEQEKSTTQKESNENIIIQEQNLISSSRKKKRKKNNIPKKENFSPIFQQPSLTEELIIEPAWNNVFFKDGYIVIKHQEKYYQIQKITNSKSYLNNIKGYYDFHKVPRLRIIISRKGNKIENEEILFYHIAFLNTTASIFDFIKLEPFQMNFWKKYNSKYYKKNLPFAFQSETLKKLCEYSDPELPIIPVGEIVYGLNKKIKIHNSFLFPLKSKVNQFIIWESIEEPKASYVFSINSSINNEIQTIFNFIVSKIPNKRSELINKYSLQKELNFSNRIFHNDLKSWDSKIKELLKQT